MAIHLPIGSLKTRSGLEPVPRCEPSTYLADDITSAPSGPVKNHSTDEHLSARACMCVCVCVCVCVFSFVRAMH